MVIIQSISKRKSSGGRYKAKLVKKRQHLIGRQPAMTKIAGKRLQKIRGRSAIVKNRLLSTDKINLYDPKTKKYSLETIKNVIDVPSNKNFIRRKIVTKGAIVETAKGNAKITSRPGQDGVVNGVLVQ